MENVARIVAALVAAYLIGAIPFALIVGKVGYGIDLREHGSGNLGATNVNRVLGWRSALLVALLDVAKGALAVGLAAWVFGFGIPRSDPFYDWMLICAFIAAILGHSYSPYIRFSGGKGIATAAGGLIIITPVALLILLATFIVVIALTRWVSLGSIVIAAEFPFLVLLLYGDREPFVIMSFLASALVLWRHRSNMVRIVRGEESKISFTARGRPEGKE